MKLKIDREADALFLTLDDGHAVESQEVSPGIIVDTNAQGIVVGIEMLQLSKRAPDLDPEKLVLETVPPAAAE
ncbi:MAG: DUF2283 domain-containing protein [Alphaproteobacteria bacterium]|nr:DUF2283 domain-containing protein [Alphaproteobacteria bacterium]